VNERRAFRGLALPLNKNMCQDDRWWSVSARAVPPSQGSIVRFRGVIADISQAKLADARVRHMAHYDGLTDLPNRTFFVSAINRQFQTMHPAKRLALLLVDVDHFKSVNDIYGHPIGDAFVKQVGQRIVQCTQTSGLGGEGHIVARLGGDEFAILMGGEDVVDHSVRLAELLVQTLAQPFTIGDHTINSSASLGIALAPDHANNAQMLQSNADIALYAAKNGGRNRWELFETGMDIAVQQRHAIERDLRIALTKNQLRLYFQPLINVETGLPTGFEALVRWEHPENGMIMPNDFIPIAESSGLIVPLGEWVIRTAMAEAVRWKDPHTIAVNLSPIQLSSANLLPTIINALAETGLDPARLEVEITESVLLNDCEANIAVLNRLHDLGVKIALDDFGTGYASLNYLRTFPFDKIKIDRSFVTELAERADCRAIVSAVISLANNLGMCTLAEGVESEEQLAALRSEGCAMVQGWLFGKAMPADHYSSLRNEVDSETAQIAAPEPQDLLPTVMAA
jgi:diguanylate cyclase (GGDEF)-like protein